MNPPGEEEEGLATQLFESHRERVLAFVHCYCHQDNPDVKFLEDDIRSEALLGLWQACTRFKQTDKNTFWTFAYLRVRGAVIDYLRREKITVRGDRLETQQQHIVEHYNPFKKERTQHWTPDRRGGSGPGDTEDTGFNPDKSLPREYSGVEAAISLSQSIALAQLTEQEATVLKQHHGEGHSAQDIAERHHLGIRIAYLTLRRAEEKIRAHAAVR